VDLAQRMEGGVPHQDLEPATTGREETSAAGFATAHVDAKLRTARRDDLREPTEIKFGFVRVHGHRVSRRAAIWLRIAAIRRSTAGSVMTGTLVMTARRSLRASSCCAVVLPAEAEEFSLLASPA